MLSVVIPVFNEEPLLDTAVRSLAVQLDARPWSYELWVVENGSRDRTADIADRLAEELPHVFALHVPEPNYGRALRRGIENARGTFVLCDEIDLGDFSFYDRALGLLEKGADLVVGSKRHADSKDHRPWVRRRGTQVINSLLRLSLGFKGTDTHGLKAFRRARLLPVVETCQVEHDLFASELVIRAQRAGIDVLEVPLQLREIRPPSVALHKRVPRVLKNLVKLIYVIRVRP